MARPDRPPRRGVAADSEIRSTSSRDKLWLDSQRRRRRHARRLHRAPRRPASAAHPWLSLARLLSHLLTTIARLSLSAPRSAKLCAPANSKRIFIFDKPSTPWLPHPTPSSDTSKPSPCRPNAPSIRLVPLGASARLRSQYTKHSQGAPDARVWPLLVLPRPGALGSSAPQDRQTLPCCSAPSS